MELDSAAVVSRVLMKSSDAAASGASTGHAGQVRLFNTIFGSIHYYYSWILCALFYLLASIYRLIYNGRICIFVASNDWRSQHLTSLGAGEGPVL